jgi:diguanylate cyclase (GGDEF)-like protein
MSINVSLETISLPELLRSIDIDAKSGRLILEPWVPPTDDNITNTSYTLWFDRGKFVAIQEDSSQQEMISLIKSRDWVKKLIGEKLDRLCPQGEPLGIYLHRMKLLTREQIDFIFQIQLDRAYQLFAIESGRLIFTEIAELIEQDSQTTLPWLEMTGNSVKASQLILNGMQLLGNWDNYQKRLPNADLSLQKIASQTDLDLLPLESQLWMRANSQASIATIAQQLDRPLLQVQRAAFVLIAAGLVKEIPLTNLWSKIARSSSLPNLATHSELETPGSILTKPLPSVEHFQSKRSKKLLKAAITAVGVTAATVACTLTGMFQLLELGTLDRAFRWRASEAPDRRIVVVTIDDPDINKLGQWPMSDAKLAQVLKNLQKQNPRAIGLDLYRDIPVEPGHQQLLQVYRNMPNLIGIEKAVGQKVAPPPVLSQLQQVATTDTLVDLDSRVRRSLISLESDRGELKLGLGVQLSLIYLEAQGINLETSTKDPHEYRLGKAIFHPLTENAGGYVRNNVGGYQIMLNYPSAPNKFKTISLTDVLANRFSGELIRDRIVLIGASADSLKDFFLTPHSYDNFGTSVGTPGVFIHANITSQILSAALDGRPLLKVWSEPQEWLWIGGWSLIGTILGLLVLKINLTSKKQWMSLGLYLLVSSAMLLIADLIFLAGWWVPTVAPWIAFSASTLLVASDRQQDLRERAYLDKLTNLFNRLYCQRYLEQQWQQEHGRDLALIFCEVDQLYLAPKEQKQQEECLVQITKVIEKSVRGSDLISRYEEDRFAVVLPNTNTEAAIEVARKIQEQVQALNISLSCGVASAIVTTESSPTELIAMTDEALYRAKKQERVGV